MPYHAGYEEDKFLRSLAPLDINEIELLASNCTEVHNSKLNYAIFVFQLHKFLYLPDINVAYTNEKESSRIST